MPGPDLSINFDDRSNTKLLAIVSVERDVPSPTSDALYIVRLGTDTLT